MTDQPAPASTSGAAAPSPRASRLRLQSLSLVLMALLCYLTAVACDQMATYQLTHLLVEAGQLPQPPAVFVTSPLHLLPAFLAGQTHLSSAIALSLPGVLLRFAVVCLLGIGLLRWALHGRQVVASPAMPGDAEILRLLGSINDRMLVSDTAKRIAYRHEDIAVLRRNIEQDLEQGHFSAAMAMVHELAETYGHREEAEGLRARILEASRAVQDAKINEALNRLKAMIAQHEFQAAREEAARIKRLYPDVERLRMLDRQVEQAREQYKHHLEREFLIAAQRDDIERADQLLHQLDHYLTPAEAEPFRETARGVIGKKRDNFGVQFKLAIQDKEWVRAVEVGERIIREFPNSQMADEIRERLDLLRERAASQRAAGGNHVSSPSVGGA